MAELCPDNTTPLSAANPGTSQSSIVADIEKVVTAATPMYDIANKLASAAKNYNAINSVVNQLIGYDTKWFRAVPQQRSKDVIFLEYTLSNVEECPLNVKVVLGSNMPPDSKYNYDLMGLEYEVPFEVQLDKKYWESLAGYGTAPQKRDIVYMPISNKLFQVESAYLFRGFMEQETTWKINLIKYQPMASRKESAALQETIDSYTVSVEEIFGETIDNEVKKLSDEPEMSAFNSTSKDKYKAIDASLSTVTSQLNIYGTIVAQSFYDMQTSNSNVAITFNASEYITDHMDRSVLAWIMPRTIPDIVEYAISTITAVTFSTSYDTSLFYDYDATLFTKANYSVTFSRPVSVNNIDVGDDVVISREGELNLYAKVVAISTGPLTYHVMINDYVRSELASIKSDWYNMKGFNLTVKSPINLIDGVNDFGTSVLSANLYANQFLTITYGSAYTNEKEYAIRLDDKLLDDTWYGIVVNFGNEWKQCSVYVWEKHTSSNVDKLQINYYKTVAIVPENITIDSYRVKKSYSYLTNLRMYNVNVEEDRQRDELLRTFTADADKLILASQGEEIIKMPYISQQR